MPASIHEHPEEWLAVALADGLSPEESRALDEHLAGCERCRALQAEFAALDETLLRDFPLAVGPNGGFETRLVAGFRRRQGKSWRLTRVRELAAWLLRQRGVRFAGVAAALLGLVWLGQTLTGDRHRAPFIANDARIIDGAIDQSAVENNMESAKRLEKADLRNFFKPQSHVAPGKEYAAADDAEAVAGPKAGESLPQVPGNLRPFDRLSSVMPARDINVGRDVTAGLGDVQTPLTTGEASGSSDFAFNSKKPSSANEIDHLLLDGISTFTGATTVNGGTLAINGTMATRRGSEIDAREQRPGRNKAFDGFINDGSPIQTVTQNGSGLTQDQSPVPVLASSTPGDAPPANSSPAATPAPPDVRKLIRNARAELEVTSFDATVDAVTAAAARDGGFLDTRNSARGGNGKIQGSLVVKVLPENLDRFLAGLRALGDVKNQTIQTEDVTKDYFDTDARLRNSRRMEERLLKMLDEVKGKMSEVLQVEKELARVRGEIETMQGQLKLYDAQVRYATVTLDVRERDLNQPAAFLLRETATLSLLAADVERTAAEVRRIADAAHAQTVRSEVTRDPAGKSRATLRLLIAPEGSADVIGQIKALGRVENFHVQDERTAQNGTSADAAAQDPAKVERAPVTLDLTISHDEQISRQVSLTLVAGDVEGAFEKARAAAVAAGGEIVESNVTRPSAGHANAVLGVRVPASASAALLAAFQSLGRAGEAETRRMGSGPEADAGPVLIRLSVVDAEPAVQQTIVRVQTAEVERRAADLKREAAASHATVEESNFASESDGRQRAGLRFRLPISAYAEFVERVRALGTVKDFTVQRSDRPAAHTGEAAEANAPVVVDLLLYSDGRIVGEESGLSSTLRRTFGQGAGALMWSVRMIGVAVAFLAPWVVLLALGIGVVRWRRRKKG